MLPGDFDRRQAVVVGAILAAYLALSLAWISLPGPDADEALFVAVWYRYSPLAMYVDHIRVFHSKIVTMVGSYNGALKGWVWSLFFAAGRSVYTMRVPAVLLAAVTLALFYRWARRVYSQPTAAVALLLAAIDPAYIVSSRIDSGPVVLQRLLFMAGIMAGTSWALDPARAARVWSRLAVSGFFFGLALWDKATFAWCLLALAATLLVLFPGQVRQRLRPASIAVFVFFLCLGSLPLLLYNARTATRGTREVTSLESFDAETWNLKWHNFRLTLNGYYLYGTMGGESIDRSEVATVHDTGQRLLDALGWFAPERGTWLLWALAAAALVGVAAAWRRRRAILFPLLLALAHWIAVSLTRGAGGPHHFTLIYPFPHLGIAAAGFWLWEESSRLPRAITFVARRGLALALAAVVLTELAYDARQLSAFRQIRGAGIWSDAIYDIAGYLKAHRPDLVVNMDWGFGNPLLFLTDDQVRQKEFYEKIAFEPPENQAAHVEELVPLLSRPNTLFLTHTEPFLCFPATGKVFEQALTKAGRRARLVRRFYQSTGEAVAQLVRVE
jgi:hypothetical protein